MTWSSATRSSINVPITGTEDMPGMLSSKHQPQVPVPIVIVPWPRVVVGIISCSRSLRTCIHEWEVAVRPGNRYKLSVQEICSLFALSSKWAIKFRPLDDLSQFPVGIYYWTGFSLIESLGEVVEGVAGYFRETVERQIDTKMRKTVQVAEPH